MSDPAKAKPIEHSPFSLANIRLFVGFRVFFNTRFYYPVFTILFLDYGLTLEQFALLNTLWAVTIVLAEVPSGALADLLGRKRLLVITSLLMVAEMMTIGFVPLGSPTVIFVAFLVNRVLSGLAEAMASGADEAIAYDTLVAENMEKEWPRVLDIQMRLQHFGYLFAMTIGAVVYDADMLTRILHRLGSGMVVTGQVSMRFPVYLTLVLALLALGCTLRMRDPLPPSGRASEPETRWQRIVAASRLTWEAGGWILRTPFALAVILVGMSYDHVLRMLVTMTSQYFRLIGLPEAGFGLIGSGIAVIGMIIPRMARAMVHRFTPLVNAAVVGMIAFTALWGLTLCIPLYGILPVVLLFIGMMLTSFFTSHYLNTITDSSHRATVLSFKGLAFNAAYGLIGLLYAALVDILRERHLGGFSTGNSSEIAGVAFRESLVWFPGYLTAMLVTVALVLLTIRFVRRSQFCRFLPW